MNKAIITNSREWKQDEIESQNIRRRNPFNFPKNRAAFRNAGKKAFKRYTEKYYIKLTTEGKIIVSIYTRRQHLY